MKKINTSTLRKVLRYIAPYKFVVIIVIASVILLSAFAALRPYMVKQIVDNYVEVKDANGLAMYSFLIGVVLLVEVVSQYSFSYSASWLGQRIVKDIREELFHKITHFKLRYFDKESVGRLITRNVSDMEAIASIFSQGLFMIIADVLKMVVVLGIMLWMNWQLTLVVIVAMPILLYATRVFQQHMKKAFDEVRTQVANLNSFVQERITGMKIVQLFTREKKEYENFEKINQKHNHAWQKNILYNSIFFQ